MLARCLCLTLLAFFLGATQPVNADTVDSYSYSEFSSPWKQKANWRSLKTLIYAVFANCSAHEVGGVAHVHPDVVTKCKKAQRRVRKTLRRKVAILPTTATVLRLHKKSGEVEFSISGIFCQKMYQTLHDDGANTDLHYLLTRKQRGVWYYTTRVMGDQDCMVAPARVPVATTFRVRLSKEELKSFSIGQEYVNAELAVRLKRRTTYRVRLAKNAMGRRRHLVRALLAKPIAWRVAIANRVVVGKIR